LPGPYLVYHDAFGYFEKQFGLGHDLTLVEDPEISPGIRQIMTVRAAITDISPSCLFIDESANQATINTMLSGYDINQVSLDLLGKRLVETESYETLMENLVFDFINCF
jgi:zinc transport system substrate-binding protein